MKLLLSSQDDFKSSSSCNLVFVMFDGIFDVQCIVAFAASFVFQLEKTLQ